MTRRAFAACVAFALAGIAVAAAWWPSLPEMMPIHWGASGQPDNVAPRSLAVALGPALSLAMPLFVAALLRVDPRREHVQRSEGAIEAMLVGMSAFGFGLQVIMLRAAMSAGQSLDTGALLTLLGVLFVVLGLALPKARSNWFFGVRTPWTLQSEAVWHLTHRVAGFTMVGAGVSTIVAGWALAPEVAVYASIGVLLAGSLFPVAYSYVAYQRIEGDSA